ncbi:hypothetical protein ACOSP7_024873 [Xanthoceras sorbifolium]
MRNIATDGGQIGRWRKDRPSKTSTLARVTLPEEDLTFSSVEGGSPPFSRKPASPCREWRRIQLEDSSHTVYN